MALDGLIYANFEIDENANWARCSRVGTLKGNASVSSGSLLLPNGTNNYIEYTAHNNVPDGDTFTIEFRYKPSYSGAPASTQYLFAMSDGEDNSGNLIRLIHIGTNIRWDVYDKEGNSIKVVQTGNTFNPVAGTAYTIAFCGDTANGEYRLFIDGVNVNGLQTSDPGEREQMGGIIRFGKDYTSVNNTIVNSEILDFILYDSVKYTADYTPDWSIPSSPYADTCLLFGFIRVQNVDLENVSITITPSKSFAYSEDDGIELFQSYHVQTDDLGYWEQLLVVNVDLDVTYTIDMHYQDTNGKVYHRQYNNIIIPDQASLDFSEIG